METPGSNLHEFMGTVDLDKITSRATLLFLQFNTLMCQVSSIEATLSKMNKKLDELMYRVRKLETRSGCGLGDK